MNALGLTDVAATQSNSICMYICMPIQSRLISKYININLNTNFKFATCKDTRHMCWYILIHIYIY